MKRYKNFTLDPLEFEDFIWMSYRYCIGRKTIAASNHANTIFNILMKNPDVLSEERKEFIAKDIRKCILDTIRWNKCIKINNLYMGDDNWDMYSSILVASNSCNTPKDAIYTLDAASKIVTWNINSEKTNNTIHERFDDMYYDLMPWVKLSNWLDKKCHKIIKTDNDKQLEIICYPYVTFINGKYEMVWDQVSHTNIITTSFINPNCITNICDIE